VEREHTALDRYTSSVRPPSLPTIDLMQPKLVSRPFHRPGWVYEEKYDGWRMLAYLQARLREKSHQALQVIGTSHGPLQSKGMCE